MVALPTSARKNSSKESPSAALPRDGIADFVARNLFIGKVLSIQTCMLLVSASAVGLVTMSPNLQELLRESHWIAFACMLHSSQIIMLLDLYPRLRLIFPINFLLAIVLTLTQAVSLSSLLSTQQTGSILIAMTVTCACAGTVAVIALYAIWNMTQFTSHMIVSFYVLGCVQFGVVLICPSLCPQIPVVDRVVGGLMAVTYCAYNAAVLQVIADAQDYSKNDVGDYIATVLMMHMDVLNVVINILKIIVGTKRRRQLLDKEFSLLRQS